MIQRSGTIAIKSELYLTLTFIWRSGEDGAFLSDNFLQFHPEIDVSQTGSVYVLSPERQLTAEEYDTNQELAEGNPVGEVTA